MYPFQDPRKLHVDVHLEMALHKKLKQGVRYHSQQRLAAVYVMVIKIPVTFHSLSETMLLSQSRARIPKGLISMHHGTVVPAI